MDKVCILCGNPLGEDGKCSVDHQIRRMCVNCKSCGSVTDAEGVEKRACQSQVNMGNARKKALETLKTSLQGYELSSMPELELKPLPLKNALSKCSQWELSDEIRNNIESIFQ